MMDEDRASYCRILPKIELHAHLSGSISKNTMSKLIEMKRRRDPEWKPSHVDFVMQLDASRDKSLQGAFMLFDLIHEISDTEEAAYIATKDIIKEFSADNVKYLELRTTPRCVSQTGMSKQSYINSVLRAISECQHDSDIDTEVRLLLAIDRKASLSDAMDTVELATEYMSQGDIVTGVDLSGNPMVNDARDFLPVLLKAKSTGLKLALHLAEVPHKETEILALLEIPPDRIGHGTYLHKGNRYEEIVNLVSKDKIPIEICPTSNMFTQAVTVPKDLHFHYWFEKRHPITICTDDKGVFFTSLSEEYQMIAEAFHLSENELYELSYHSIDYAFVSEDIKKKLQTKWTLFKSEFCQENGIKDDENS